MMNGNLAALFAQINRCAGGRAGCACAVNRYLEASESSRGLPFAMETALSSEGVDREKLLSISSLPFGKWTDRSRFPGDSTGAVFVPGDEPARRIPSAPLGRGG